MELMARANTNLTFTLDWNKFFESSAVRSSHYGNLLTRFISLGQAIRRPRESKMGFMRRWALRLARRRLKLRLQQIVGSREETRQMIRTLRRVGELDIAK